MIKNSIFKLLFLIPFVALNFHAFTQENNNIEELSFEDLMNLEITSISKKAENIKDVPSSIYVITQDDIQRSTASNLMQLLRDNVPGYWGVANDYKASDAFIRNGNEGSVLILLDGTPMMDNLFMNFDYENFEIPFEQIDRIEVIKGSGGTIYGANSATGVISIFTKNPEDQSKIIASAEYATPGQTKVSLIATPISNDKFSASVYGKYSSFSGFDQMDEVTNETSVVPSQEDPNTMVTITNRFTEDDRSSNSNALGLNLGYNASEKLKLSTAIHYNQFNSKKYYQTYPPEQSEINLAIDSEGNPYQKLYAADEINYNDHNISRLVGNVKVDYSFSEKHNLFARVSTNMDNTKYSFGGGFTSNSGIIDFEIQDNLDLSYNFLSFGANYRSVNFDIDSSTENSSIYYTDPNENYGLMGVFAQDKISLLDEKLKLYFGIKAEHYSLISDKFYFSPTAKFSYTPIEMLTVWGGYSQSYTTPGYNQTNIEYSFFRANSPDVFVQPVTQGVYGTAYAGALQQGYTEEQALAFAQNYVQSDEGQAIINQQVSQQAEAFPGHLNIGAISGPETKPSSFQNYEIGLRMQPLENLSFETNFFYSVIKDGIGNSPSPMAVVPSAAHEGENINTFYYGNYFKGNNTGLETVIKYYATTDLMIELSHSLFLYDQEFQENDDFDISTLTDEQKATLKHDDYPQLPENVLRAKIYYTLNHDWKFTLATVYSSSYFVRFGTLESSYSYENQRLDPPYSDGGTQYLIGGKQDSRFILNLRIDKYFMDKKLNVYAYGNDLTHLEPFTDGVNQLTSVYPRQVGGMIGVGVTYNIGK